MTKGRVVHVQRIFCEVDCRWKWQATIEFDDAPNLQMEQEVEV